MNSRTRIITTLVVLTVVFVGVAVVVPAASLLAASSELDGTVVVEGGQVLVEVAGDRADETQHLPTTNGAGLLKAGHIADGDEVRVRQADDRRHKHRGHVTILK